LEPGVALGPWVGPPGAVDGDSGICLMSGLADMAYTGIARSLLFQGNRPGQGR